MKYLLLVCFCIPFISLAQANKKNPKEVEAALQKAGKNKIELQKAINYFKKSNNPLKLRAVFFLISNMDIHYSVTTYLSNAKGKRFVFNELKYPNYLQAQAALKSLKTKYNLYEALEQIPDLKVVKSSFLINNIEYAFSAKNSDLIRFLKFEDFCEYVLPYRVATEPVTDWRGAYQKRFSFLSVNTATKDSKTLAGMFSQDFKNWFSNTFGSEERALVPRLGAMQLLFYKKGPCEDISDLVGFAFRSQGLPVALDEVTYWGTASGRHYFNTVFDKNMKPFPVFDISTKTFTNTPFQREPAKVIRRTFSKQPGVISRILPAKLIPPGFMRSQNFMDVTSSYWRVKDVTARILKKKSNQPKYAFVSVFNELNWKPTWWGQVRGDSVTFKSMSQGVVYLPQYYVNGKLEPAGYPVISGYSRQAILKPEMKSKRTVKIFAKDKYLVFRKGWHYMLHYWTSKGWELLETELIKDPTVKYLEFKGIPANSLLLLLPEHSENMERPFTIADDGTQQWW